MLILLILLQYIITLWREYREKNVTSHANSLLTYVISLWHRHF